MDSYTRTVVNLKVLAEVKDHERLTIDMGVFSIQHVSRGRMARVWNWLYRYSSGNSRRNMITHLDFLSRDCEHFRSHQTILDCIPDAVKGLKSLRRTYADDVATTASIEFIENRLLALVE